MAFKMWDVVTINNETRKYTARFWYYMTANPKKAAVLVQYHDYGKEEDIRWEDVDNLTFVRKG